MAETAAGGGRFFRDERHLLLECSDPFSCFPFVLEMAASAAELVVGFCIKRWRRRRQAANKFSIVSGGNTIKLFLIWGNKFALLINKCFYPSLKINIGSKYIIGLSMEICSPILGENEIQSNYTKSGL